MFNITYCCNTTSIQPHTIYPTAYHTHTTLPSYLPMPFFRPTPHPPPSCLRQYAYLDTIMQNKCQWREGGEGGRQWGGVGEGVGMEGGNEIGR
jgi:hypothetical protein